MEAKTSKAMLEVWEAKNRLYEELKNIPIKDRSKYIDEKTKAAIAKLRKARLNSQK